MGDPCIHAAFNSSGTDILSQPSGGFNFDFAAPVHVIFYHEHKRIGRGTKIFFQGDGEMQGAGEMATPWCVSRLYFIILS
jgi:hypothetical protein